MFSINHYPYSRNRIRRAVDQEDNIIEKTIDSTTYDFGNGQIQTIYHGTEVRFEDENGNLRDYDPALVEIEEKETALGESLEEYAFENREGDKKQYLPEHLSEDTPIILENENYHIHFSPTNKSLETNGAEALSLEIKEEQAPSEDPDEENVKKLTAAEYAAPDSAVDITYSSQENGVKETLLLKEKPESNIEEVLDYDYKR